jgi:hypothetical protein
VCNVSGLGWKERKYEISYRTYDFRKFQEYFVPIRILIRAMTICSDSE